MCSKDVPKSVPVMVTVVPPAVGPLLGETPVILGGGQPPDKVLKDEEQVSASSVQVEDPVHHPQRKLVPVL